MSGVINDDARMAELYKMRSEGVELEWFDPDYNKWREHDIDDPESEICRYWEYRPKAKPVYVWAYVSTAKGKIVIHDWTTDTPKTAGMKRYQLIEAPEDE